MNDDEFDEFDDFGDIDVAALAQLDVLEQQQLNAIQPAEPPAKRPRIEPARPSTNRYVAPAIPDDMELPELPVQDISSAAFSFNAHKASRNNNVPPPRPPSHRPLPLHRPMPTSSGSGASRYSLPRPTVTQRPPVVSANQGPDEVRNSYSVSLPASSNWTSSETRNYWSSKLCSSRRSLLE
jgi:hypothetical protein